MKARGVALDRGLSPGYRVRVMSLPHRALGPALLVVLWLVAICLVERPARAHINLLEPAPRAPGRPDTQLSLGPCGQRENERREDGVTVLRPGQSLDLTWEVYVQHASYFRIAFDADGDDSFSARPTMPPDPAADDPTTLPPGEGELILDYILDPTGSIDRVERRVTLPDVECERCTLQVIQFTYGLPIARATYHQCVDLVLDASAPVIDPGSTDPGSIDSGSGDREGDDGQGPALDSEGSADTASGCSLSRSAAPGGAGSRGALPRGATLLACAAALALARRRTRRRHGG